MNAKRLLGWLAGGVLAMAAASAVWAYTFITDEGGYVNAWAPGSISFQVKLATSPALSDGTSQSASVVAAMAAWNAQLGVVQFSAQQVGPGAYSNGNEINEIVIDSTIDGDAFGENTLAVTISWTDGNERVESDIVFNTAWTWDSYRGNLLVAEDIRRVAIHELGHVLGLDHPDLATPPQSVTAIMNSTVSNIDTMQPDDITGAQVLYGSPDFVPANNDFANATTINLSSGATQVTGTNIAATAEAGEPALDADDPGRRTVWWRWTAPADGSITITTLGSNFDTLMGVYTGASVEVLTQVALNDDADPGVIRTSTVTFNATSGTTYFAAVDGWGGYFGAITLNLDFTPAGAEIAPIFTSQPSSQSVSEGQNAQFSVSVSGSPTLSYRWQRLPAGGGTWYNLDNDGIYTFATTTTLKVNSTTAAMNGDQFRCVATNWVGVTTSNAVTLTVNYTVTAPVITSQDASLAGTGDYSQLAVYVTGAPPPAYQWQRLPAGDDTWINLSDDLIFSGTRQYRLIALMLASMNGNQFRCVVTNSAGSATSNPVTVTAGNPTKALGWVVYDFPSSAATGSQVSGTATVVNAGTATWGPGDWLVLYGSGSQEITRASLNGTAPGDSITVTLTFQAPYEQVSTAYHLQPANDASSFIFTSRSFGFGTFGATVPPTIVTQPVGRAANVGDNISFTVLAIGQFPFSYQWRLDGVDIPGATSATLALPNVQVAAAGVYTVKVTNPLGFAVSNPAILTLGIPPGVSLVAAAGDYTLFLRSNATRWGLGYGFGGQFGDGTINGSSQPIQINDSIALLAAGPDQSAFVKLDGSLWATGRYAGRLAGSSTEQQVSPIAVTNGTNVAAVEMGFGNTYVIRTDGTLWGAGTNSSGQVGDGTTTYRNTLVQIATDVMAVASGNLHTVFLKGDRTLWGMGRGGSGALGNGMSGDVNPNPRLITQDVIAVGAGINYTAFLKADGSLWTMGSTAWPPVSSTPTQISSGVIKLAAGDRHLLFIKSDGTLWAIGQNDRGQLGDGTTTDRSTPVQMTSDVIEAGAGGLHSLFIKSDGSLWGTGSSQFYQVGNQVGMGTSTPVLLASGAIQPPAAPATISAGDGTTVNMVRITWSHAAGASGYEIWRHTTNASGGAARIGTVSGQSLYYDNTATPGTAYFYWVKAINGGGASGFSPVDFGYSALPTPPAFVLSPANNDYPLGSTPLPSFMAVASGNPTPAYQWQHKPAGSSTWSDMSPGDTNVTGVLSGTLAFNSLPSYLNGYQYRCVATNSGGTATSNAAVLSFVNGPGAPVITAHPRNAFPSVGARSYFAVAASGTPALSYRWQLRAAGSDTWSNISPLEIYTPGGGGTSSPPYSGHTSPNLVVTATRAMSGDQFRCVVTNSAGSVTSNPATLTVTPPAADFNADDKSDLLFTNTVTGERSARLMNGTTLDSEVSLGTVGTDWSAVTGDFNADGSADLLWQNTVTGDCYIWLMNGTATSSSVFLGNIGAQWSVAGTGDLNADGQTDILWSNTTTGDRYVWLMNGTVLSSSVHLGNLSPRWLIAGTGDFNADGQTDIVWQNIVTGERRIWLMNGTTRSSQVSLGVASTTLRIAVVGDYNADGKPDLVWQNTSSGERLIWLMNGTEATSSVSLGVVGTQWIIGQNVVPAPSTQTASDFNADGQSDLLWSNTTNGDRYFWLMNGTRVASSVFVSTVAPEWTVVTGDFNTDGQSDLLWSSTANGDRYVWLMNGTRVASSVFVSTVAPEWTVVTGDFNADGQTDLLWSSTANGDRYVWLMNGTSVASSVFLSTVAPVWSVTTGDYNADGQSDLFWSNTSSGDRYVWLMNGTAVSSSVFLSTVAPQWRVAN